MSKKTHIAGTWKLKAWRRIAADGTVTLPFGENPLGLLIYSPDGSMAVQMQSMERATLDSTDPLGGTTEARAQAYSSCLAYFGSYQVQGDEIVHQVDGSLFPNWSHTEQIRPYSHDGQELVLRTPKSTTTSVVNEIVWERHPAHS